MLLTASMTGAASAQGNACVKAGILTCDVAGGFGLVLGSTRLMNCTYDSNSGNTEQYHGSMSVLGADIGYLRSSVIVWAVLAPTSDTQEGALAGIYLGASARVAVGSGTGVNVMIGGLKNSIALQPISVEVNTGLYVGGGIGVMSLKLGDPES